MPLVDTIAGTPAVPVRVPVGVPSAVPEMQTGNGTTEEKTILVLPTGIARPPAHGVSYAPVVSARKEHAMRLLLASSLLLLLTGCMPRFLSQAPTVTPTPDSNATGQAIVANANATASAVLAEARQQAATPTAPPTEAATPTAPPASPTATVPPLPTPPAPGATPAP